MCMAGLHNYCVYSIVQGAVHRHFESMKRAYTEENAEGDALEKVKRDKSKRKKAARTHRVRLKNVFFE